MKLGSLSLDEKLVTPSLLNSRNRSQFTYQNKNENSAKYKIKSDLKLNFLTRYNKKFWESDSRENLHQTQANFHKPEKTQLERYKSQNLRKVKPLDLMEVDDFENRMKNELENIDRWVFNNLKKMSLNYEADRRKDRSRKKMINLDVQMLNFIIQTSHHAIDSPTHHQKDTTNIPDVNVGKDITNRIAITSETLNNEYNKTILVELLRKKMLNHKDCQNKDNSFNMMLAKMVASDLIASFKALNVFRHQNVLRLKELLETLPDSLESAAMSLTSHQHSESADDYMYYERSLKKSLKECEDDIRSRKDMSKKLLDTIRQKKTSINTEKQRLFDFIKMLEDKESESNKNRKIGEKMKLREYMEINEFKSKKIKLEATINLYIKITNREIDEMNKRIEKIEKEIEEFKFKKTWFIYKLKEFYLDFVKKENELLKINKNLISIIKSIWNLNEEVFLSSFSKFYEKEDIAFVLKYAKIHNKFLSARESNNSQKKEIKDSLKKNFDDILNENEYEIISSFKENLRKFKSHGLKLYERKPIKSSNQESLFKYCEVVTTANRESEKKDLSSKIKLRLETDQVASSLSQLSEKLSQLKEQHIDIVLKRTIERNNRSKLLGYCNSEYLKKVLRLLFGHQDMQIILQRLLKNNQIQIIPI